jgi:hypothetical protein
MGLIDKLWICFALHKGDIVRLRFEPFELLSVKNGEPFFAYLAKYAFHFADLCRLGHSKRYAQRVASATMN